MLTSRIHRGFAVLVALASGCELTRELGVYTAIHDEASAHDDTDTGSDPQEGGTSHGETQGDDGDDAPGDGDGESGDGEPGDGDGEPGDGDGEPGDGDDLCRIDGSEDPCQVCLEYLCCEFLNNCDAESGCNCMLECLMETDAVECAPICAPGPAYFQLLQCQLTSCNAVCGT